MLNIEIFDPKYFDSSSADELIALIRDRLAEKERCSIVLSGGSTPAGVYRALSAPQRSSEIDWSRVDLFLGDERWVSHDDKLSNLKMIRETLLQNIEGSGLTVPAVYPIDTSLATCQDGADSYSALLARYLSGHGDRFDIVLLGLGEDGHTASLFPGSPFVLDSSSICFSVDHPSDGTKRVTIGFKPLFDAWRVIYLVKGLSKGEMVRRVINGADSVIDIPARLYLNREGETTFLLDSEAASKLKR